MLKESKSKKESRKKLTEILKFRKISTKITLAITVLVFMLSFILTTINISRSSKIIEKEAKKNLELLCESKANKFNLILQKSESSIQSLSDNIFGYFDPISLKNDEEYAKEFDKVISQIVKEVMKESKALSIYAVFNPDLIGKAYDINFSMKNGQLKREDMFSIEEFKENSEKMSWYYTAAKEKKPIWLKPYFWKAYNTEIISYVVPLYVDDKLIGVIGADLDFKIFKDDINNIKVYDNGYAFLLDDKYNYLVHPTLTMEDNMAKIGDGAFTFITEIMNKQKSALVECKYNGEDKIMSFAKVSNGDVIVLTASKSEIFTQMESLRWFMILLAIVGVFIVSIIGLFLGKNISKPILKVTELLNKTEQLDLEYDSSCEFMLDYKDETGVMARALLNTRRTLRQFIGNIKQNFDNINDEANNLASVSQEMSSSSENVSNAIQEVARGSGEQAEGLIDTSKILNEFSEELESIVQAIKEIDINAKGVQTVADKSNNNMQVVVETVVNVRDSFQELILKITSLNTNISKINEISNLINNIADQTNLLALNAAIEAARAGEAGKGFAVVADEIRKLAEQSKSSAEDINGLVNKILEDTDNMVQTTDVVNGELHNQNKDINIAINSFKEIISAIDEIIPQIEVVDNSALNINSKKDNIVEKVEEASAVSEEVSASSEEIAASSEEMSASTEEVTSAAQTLNNMTEKMTGEINKFKL
ncbi:methyl-accepting chemotaxis protein [Clostridium ganghwense]|uniref:Methyl-accepting chemotaxis protein n=1 Tax=Clostridium ganghwense TaxID=312089 RepID=A0ABT4CK14_9CLOT|nr:methyl-accepting chemotaxis protein [Clostridium ganghwense]MCY6369258.1 methyl-accepting chemotaxis protein [Clostridium ganghwense]